MLVPVSKIRRFASSVDDLGWCNLGYLVRVSKAHLLDKTDLLYLAFQALVKNHNKDIPDKPEALIEYISGNSELNGDDAFNDQFKEIRADIEQLSVPVFYKVTASLGFWMFLASFAVIFFVWWLIFIVPPLIWFVSSWAKNMHQLNHMANLAILSHRSEPFREFCKEIELIADFPDDLSSFVLIGDLFGGSEIFRLNADEWDLQLESDIINGINAQKLKLTIISNLMSCDRLET
jgi:hypothetical protein